MIRLDSAKYLKLKKVAERNQRRIGPQAKAYVLAALDKEPE
jgi:hypothetical protein